MIEPQFERLLTEETAGASASLPPLRLGAAWVYMENVARDARRDLHQRATAAGLARILLRRVLSEGVDVVDRSMGARADSGR